MKKYITPSLALATLIASGSLSAYDLEDNYTGRYYPTQDVVGSSASTFDIQGLNATLTGTMLTVDIFTNFAGKGDDGIGRNRTNTAASGFGNGIGYGDLLISDDNVVGVWEYGFSLDNRWSSTGGAGNLYAVNGSLASSDPVDFLLTDDFMSAGIFRDREAVAIDLDNPASSARLVNSGSWLVDETSGSLQFSIDIAGTGLPFARQGLRFGWTQTGGFDAIQGRISNAVLTGGATNVPEPTGLVLVGLGLLGTVFNRRRKLFTK